MPPFHCIGPRLNAQDSATEELQFLARYYGKHSSNTVSDHPGRPEIWLKWNQLHPFCATPVGSVLCLAREPETLLRFIGRPIGSTHDDGNG